MKINDSVRSIHELREVVEQAFQYRGELLVNMIDALTVGPRIATPSEIAASPMYGYQWSSLYPGIRAGGEKKSIEQLRRARLLWLEDWGEELREKAARIGNWELRILDATNYDRPKTPTVRMGFAHGVEGMKPGHTLSVLAEPIAAGSWCLPWEIAVVKVGQGPTEFGAEQVVKFVERYGWQSDEVLVVDAAYTNAPTLQPMKKAGVNVLGRVSGKRKFYLPPPPYSGRGRPPVRGRKIKLKDGRTLPPVEVEEEVKLADGRRFEISRFRDVRMQQWPTQPLVLYRVIEYRANGERRFLRPLWLIYLAADESMAAPSPEEGQAIYESRFSVEHGLRFYKGELGLVCGQFNGSNAEVRVQLWVELVATAMWMLFALRALADAQKLTWPVWWRSRKLTPGAMRRLALALFVTLGIAKPKPQTRGKSPGRALGTRLEPRKRYKLFRKRKRRAVA